MAATEATKRYVRGQAVRSYSRGDAVLVAIDDFSAGGTGTRQFTHADHLGSTRLITDGAGTVKNRLDFSAWGEILRADGPDLPRYGWCGAYGYQDDRLPPLSAGASPGSDLSFGLVHIGARYYDPSAGRWIMRDPIGMSGGINTYVYSENLPTTLIDPSGYMTYGDLGSAQAALGQLVARTAAHAARLTTHAFVRMSQRGITPQQIAQALLRGRAYWDPLRRVITFSHGGVLVSMNLLEPVS